MFISREFFYKSNWTASAVQVETNLLEHLSEYLQFWSWNCYSGSQSMIFPMVRFWWQISTSIKSYLTYLRSSHHFRDINIWNIWPWKSWLTSQSTTLGMAPINGKYQNLWKPHDAWSANHFRDICIWNIWPWKIRSKPRSSTFAMVPFDGKYQSV